MENALRSVKGDDMALPKNHVTGPTLQTQRVRFRFETFGDEQVWTDKLRMHDVVEKNVDPTTALKSG